MTLPWSLEFLPLDPGPLTITTTFDPIDGVLQVCAMNASEAPVSPTSIRLRATLDAPAASGYAWLQGRYMQTDALVRVFAEPLAEGYDHRSLRDAPEGRTYISRELLAIYLPVKATPALTIGSLQMERFFLDVELALDPDESTIRTIDLAFDVAGVEIGAGETLDLPPV